MRIDAVAPVVNSAAFDISAEGTLIYSAPGDTAEESGFTLLAIDRAGVETPLLEQPGSWATPRVSPDGRLPAIREIVSRVANLQLLDQRARRLMLGSLARLQAVDPGWRLHGCSTRPAVLIVAGRASLHDRHGSRRGRSPARVHGR